MKHSSTQNRLTKYWAKFPALLAISITLILSNQISFAHFNDQVLKNKCTEQNLDNWKYRTAECDPLNPPNIASGILHIANRATHPDRKIFPNGLCYPSFNNYIDSDGLAPLPDNPLFKNEQNFFVAAKSGLGQAALPPYDRYTSDQSIAPGDKVNFFIYLHNDGDPCFNEFAPNDPARPNFPRQGKFYENWNTTSKNTRVGVTGVGEDKRFDLEPGEFKTLSAFIQSENAVNELGVVGGATSDNVRLKNQTNQRLTLRLVEENPKFIDWDYNANQANSPGYNSHPISNPERLFSEFGKTISTIRKGEFKSGEGGNYFASEPYIGLVFFQFEVLGENLCEELEITATLEPKQFEGEFVHRMVVTKLDYTGKHPTPTLIRWTSTNSNGRFYIKNSRGIYIPIDPVNPDDNRVVITKNTDIVYYKGVGAISARVLETSGGTPACTENFIFRDQLPVCQELLVDHQEPIYENSLSAFRARALELDGETFAEKITFSVDPGYGYFYLEPPIGIPGNPGRVINERAQIYEPQNFWENLQDNPVRTLGNRLFGADISDFLNFGVDGAESPADQADGQQRTDEADGGGIRFDEAGGDDFRFDEPDGGPPPVATPVPNRQPIETSPNDRNRDVDSAVEADSNYVDGQQRTDEAGGSPAPTINFFAPAAPIEPPVQEVKPPRQFQTAPASPETQVPKPPTEEFTTVPAAPPEQQVAPPRRENPTPPPASLPTTRIRIPEATPIEKNTLIEALRRLFPQSGQNNVLGSASILDGVDFSKFLRFDVGDRTESGVAEADENDRTENGTNETNNPNAPSINITSETLQNLLDSTRIRPTGTITLKPESLPPAYTTLTVDPGTLVYFYALKPGQNVIHVRTENTDTDDCARDFSIIARPQQPEIPEEPETPVLVDDILLCKDLEIAANPAGSLTVGQEAQIQIVTILGTNERPLPPDTLVTFETNTGGTFEFPAGSSSPLTVIGREIDADSPVTFKNSQNPGNIIIKVSDRRFAVDTPACTETITVIQSDLVCVELSIQIREDTAAGPPTLIQNLQANTVYQITATANYNRENENQIRFRSSHGLIIPENQMTPELRALTNEQSAEEIATIRPDLTQEKDLPNGSTIFFYTFTNLAPGTIDNAINISAVGSEEFSGSCEENIPLIVPEPETVCTDISLTIKENSATGPETNTLKPNELYHLSATASFNPSNNQENSITYSSSHGVFLSAAQASLVRLSALTAEEIAILEPATRGPKTINNGESIFFFTNKNLPASIENALTVQATGFFNPECVERINLIVEVRPGPGICVDLNIRPLSGNFNPAQQTIFILDGNFRNHPGTILVTASKGTISKITENNFGSTVMFNREEISNPNTSFGIIYKPDPNFNPASDSVRIDVKAFGDPNLPAGVCEHFILTTPNPPPAAGDICVDLQIVRPESPWRVDDNDNNNRQRFEITVRTSPTSFANNLFYNWEVSGDGTWEDGTRITSKRSQTSGVTFNDLEDFESDSSVEIWASLTAGGEYIRDGAGNILCRDQISAREKERNRPAPRTDRAPKPKPELAKPVIEKLVYSSNKVQEADDLINISHNDNRYTADKYITYAIAFEPGDSDSVKITEKNFKKGRIKGISNLGGNFNFKGLRINVKNQKNKKPYALLKTEGYTNDAQSGNPLSDSPYTENSDLKIAEAEEKFKCKENGTNFCLEGDFTETINNFLDGKEITFKNLGKIGKDSLIIIKYQLTNNSAINSKICERLTAAKGCGEEFLNEVSFNAKLGDTSETGKDKARVIVLCPFILTRGGGDVFFHDVLDTGIDIAQCAEVKSSRGAGIKKTPRPQQEAPKTGAGGNTSPLILQLPSHDVCRYSNLESNIEGYNDVLKHFSSTVCELEAEVAEIWTQTHINKAIKANIKRLARFNQNLNGKQNITSMLDLPDDQSGVFVKTNGDLTINLSDKIQSRRKIPANQTYIVQGHDLIIESNIEYGNSNDKLSLKNIPSAAFIVIDGNIIIKNSVSKIEGVIMAIDTKNNRDGKITNGAANTSSEKLLLVNGNLIGDVYELFKTRIGIGDPTKDQGSVTIRYNENLLLNPPPGLGELIDITQLRGL